MMTLSIRILLFILLIGPSLNALGQEIPLGNSPDDLMQGLKELRASLDQLSSSNDDLLMRNKHLNEQTNLLKDKMQQMSDENDRLIGSLMALQKEDPGRAKHVNQLENEASNLDHMIENMVQQLKVAQNNFRDAQKLEKQINDQFQQADIQNSTNSDKSDTASIDQIKEQKRREKLAILKLIAQSQDHQQLLHQQMLDFQRNTPSIISGSNNSNQKKALEDQIQALQEEINQMNALSVKSQDGASYEAFSESQLKELEDNVKGLEKNRDELQDLMTKMQLKYQHIALNQEQKREQAKLQQNLSQIRKETQGSKMDLEGLQQQMIELDKRKTFLEALSQK